MIGFADVIEGNETVPKDGDSLDLDKKIRIRKTNKISFYALTVLMSSQVKNDIIFELTCTYLKIGDSKLVWDNINEKIYH